MKRALIIISLFAFFHMSFGQTDTTFKSTLNDTVLNKIFSYLPKGWTVIESSNQLIFQRTDSVYILENYRFDSSFQSAIKAERIEYVIKNGKKGISRIIFRYENRWNYTKTLTSKNNNTYYTQKLQKLPEKYKITSLYNKELSTRQNPVYIGITEKEKDAIKKFEKEHAEIMAKITTMPNYNTEKYSFFLVSMEGCNDNNHYVIHEDASLQLFKILTLFFEFAGQ
ncbi:MAG: hypothetical protein V1904_07190 [Bacteroidota bacterium]